MTDVACVDPSGEALTEARGLLRPPWWPLVTAGVGSVLTAVGLYVFTLAAEAGYRAYSPAEGTSAAVVFSLSGAVLMRYPAALAVGRLLLVCGLLAEASIVILSIGGAWWLVRRDEVSTFLDVADATSFVAVTLLVSLLPQLLPEGLPSGRGLRRVAAVTVGSGLLLVIALFVANQVSTTAWAETVFNLWAGWAVLALVTGLVTAALRWRRADRLRRGQLLPAAVFALLPLVALVVLTVVPSVAQLLPDVLLVAVWVAATVVATFVAIARYRLFGIDARPRRVALLIVGVAVLALSFAAICAVLLWSVTTVGRGAAPLWGAAAVAATTAILASAAATGWGIRVLRRRLLGDREAALPMLATLSDRTADDLTAELAEVFAVALDAPSVKLSLTAEAEADDEPTGAETVPLLLHGERLGELVVRPRGPGEAYSNADRQLIAVLAHQAAVQLYLRRREEEVLASRRLRVSELIAERSRIGRDLHDGLAPLLAGAGLSAEALRRGMPTGSPDEQEAARLADRLRTAAGETRRIAYALQPAALDHGLPDAVEQHLAGLAVSPGLMFETAIEVPALPADVSAAAYLIVLEGVNNVLQHARARRIRLSMSVSDGTLRLTIVDDGVGLAQPYVSGLGVGSMRERAAGLGGTLTVSPDPGGGTVVAATIPL